ncbi:MAG: hypothetical protein COX96_04555 [Candidatus Omnitrophica bacterium CG_4_10_14_0_2_um_filter_44_9]|nr:MAG: hypothetical protein COY78_04060 [Candidatus Omnitrophica bacterium CG_4_10_14_0_8_um_filter_44_12]PIZ84256.1 MAG: hypothetical protein COX96_04555 [Candidatus Omnitrophica bacterium CG_4_10_14_0_2_um_filter_44_9]
MAWETRGNNSYYYRKKRVCRKVVSEYVGKGLVAQDIYLMDLAERQERNEEAKVIKEEKNEFKLLDRQVMQSISVIGRMVEGFLAVSGFHKHKGQWRGMRNVRG